MTTDPAALRSLPAHDLGRAGADAQWRRLERALKHEQELQRRPGWQRWTIRAYGRVIEPAALVAVSGYYLIWALLHAAPWLR